MACGGGYRSRLQHKMARNSTALYRAAGGERVMRAYPPGG
jgi:hypothetical protein